MDASLMANEVALSSGYRSPAQLSTHEEEPPMLAADAQDGPEQFDFHQSFGVMTGRRLQRRYRGVYQKYSFVTQLVTWIIVIYIIIVFAVLSSNNSATTEQASMSDGIFYFALIVLGLYLLVKLALLVRWIIYWIIIAELLTYAITSNLYVLFWIDDDEVTDSDRQVRRVMIIILISVEILTVVAYWFTHYAYPWMVMHQKLNLVEWWNIKPGVETNTLTYRSKARFYSRKRNVVKYCGGLNSQGQPHGYGMWTDTAYHGERLTGQWENGVPVGPFRSFEHGSGYSFVNIRIGFCHNRGEKGSTDIFFFPKHSENGLNWGVASVECSVSGGFFKYLPTVTHITPSYEDDSPQSAAECLPALRTPTDGVVFNHKDEEAMLRGQPRKERVNRRNLFREESAPVLDLPSSDGDEGKEALVLLHGYNCSLDYGMNRLAQLLALGDFPSYIHPFVFSWPSGGVLAYFQARDVGSESERTADDFILFLKSLIDAGYTKLNIIAHSMGARVFFSSLNKGLYDEVFLPTGSHTNLGTGPKKLELSTLTFCNPDYDRNDFVKYGGGYDRARRFCSHITLYADSMDGALFYLEYLSKKTVTGPLNYSLGRRGHMVHRDPEENDVAGRSDTQFLNWQDKNLSAPQDLDLAYAAVNQRAKYPGVASFAYNRNRTACSVGACAVIALVVGKKLYIASCGDCRAIMAFREPDGSLSVEQITWDHSANDEREQERLRILYPDDYDIVREIGADNFYVKGRLQPTRSLGDTYMKVQEVNRAPMPRGLRIRGSFKRPYITAVPDVFEFDLDDRTPEFLVLGSDGLYGEMSNDEIAQAVDNLRQKGVENVSESLRAEVLDRIAQYYGFSRDELEQISPGERRNYHDDITIDVVHFTPPSATSEPAAQVA